jgi:hypothetical protein
VLTPHGEEKEGLDTLAVTEETAEGTSQGSQSTCISPASSQGGVYSVCSHQFKNIFYLNDRMVEGGLSIANYCMLFCCMIIIHCSVACISVLYQTVVYLSNL